MSFMFLEKKRLILNENDFNFYILYHLITYYALK